MPPAGKGRGPFAIPLMGCVPVRGWGICFKACGAARSGWLAPQAFNFQRCVRHLTLNPIRNADSNGSARV